jgi:hypothetical protein
MTNITILLGHKYNRLRGEEWTSFLSSVESVIRKSPTNALFAGGTPYHAASLSVCYVISMSRADVDVLVEGFHDVKDQFECSITLFVGETEVAI